MRRPSLVEIALYFVIAASLFAVLAQLVMGSVENPPPSYKGYSRLVAASLWALGVLVVVSTVVVAALVAYKAAARIARR